MPVEEISVDVLVLGSGVAGLTSALVSAIEGLDVLVCEKSNRVGGTSATSGGTVWIPGSSQAARAGRPDSKVDAARFLSVEIPGSGGAELRRAFLESGSQALDYLEQNSDVRFEPTVHHPDYHDGPGAAAGGRALSPLPFDGRRLKDAFDLIRPPLPEFMVLGGMMVSKADITHLLGATRSWSSFLHSGRIVMRHLLDRLRHKRGTRLVMGNALVGRLLYSLRKHDNAEIWCLSAPDQLLTENGVVCGATIVRNREMMRVRARRAVVLAGGGFGNGKALRHETMPARMASDRSLAFEGNVGDTIALARAVGGVLETGLASPLFMMPISVMQRDDGTEARFPHVYLDRAKPGLIAIDGNGRRFVNEADSYHDFGLAMHRSEAGVPAYLICGGRFIKKYGLGLIHPGTRNLTPFTESKYLVRAATIEALAHQIGVAPKALAATMHNYNSSAAHGIDPEFNKGHSMHNRLNGDPEHLPNCCVGPVEGPPYFAITVWPGDIGTTVGLKTDVDGAVLSSKGRPIPGLFACGNDMASVMRGTYPGPGITLGPAITFAYRVAMRAAGNPISVGRNDTAEA